MWQILANMLNIALMTKKMKYRMTKSFVYFVIIGHVGQLSYINIDIFHIFV